MTSDQLLDEGRKIQRPCTLLRPHGDGPVAAVWHDRDDDEIESTGEHCWLTIDSRFIPGLPASATGYLSIFTNEEKGKSGRVEITTSWPKRTGRDLYAHTASVLPPIDALFARGSATVTDWITSLGWRPEWRYNDNFKGADIVRDYELVWQSEFPLYFTSDIHAILGGWHLPMADDDWHALIDENLLVFTLRDSEPWVEAWHTRSGQFKVIQRIT